MLTKRQREILTIMRDAGDGDDGELVYEHGLCYVGTRRIAPRTFFAFLRLCVISRDPYNSGDFERYTINETGTKLLKALEETC